MSEAAEVPPSTEPAPEEKPQEKASKPRNKRPAASTPSEMRASGRDRKASRRIVEAEDAKRVQAEKSKEKARARSAPKAAGPAPASRKKVPTEKAASAPKPREKPAAGATRAKPPAAAAAGGGGKAKPNLLVIVVHVDGNGNSTEFWLGEKAKLKKKEQEKLADCHHGAMNDDYRVFEEVNAILEKNFEKVDEIFYGKEDVQPVSINKHVAEVYQMHFGGFDNEEDGDGGGIDSYSA